jgi:ATP-dependent helicase HrpB
MVSLPIDAVLPELLAALRGSSSVVLQAPTGAGKTTRVPPALLDGGVAGPGEILLLEPRRLAARAAARWIARERGGPLGDEVGYHVRFDRKASAKTRILAVTPGILLRRLHDDPYLESVGAVVFDEFHERGLESDLALGIVRLVQQTVRPELKVVVMSATLAVQPISAYLGGCPIVVSEGRLHPVAIAWEPRTAEQPWPAAAAAAVERLLARTPGDLLVFLPGLGEIRHTARLLEPIAAAENLAVLPLHGDLPAEQQDAALQPQTRRRIVLATNVAETSVTVEGITGVVDTGLARQMVFDARVGLDRLQLTGISKASADQRAGRAGRTQPGVCVRLWSESAHRARPDQTEPEIRRVDLAGAVLHLLSLGEKDLRRFPWLEAPREASVEQALTLLRRLGALDGGEVTEMGKSLARLPVHPRLARLLLEGQREGVPERAALAAALLAEREPFARTARGDVRRAETRSDVLDEVEALEEFERSGRTSLARGELNRNAARFVLRARDQLLRAGSPLSPVPRGERPGVRGKTSRGAAEPLTPNTSPLSTGERGVGRRDEGKEDAFLRALLAAYPDRLARRRELGGARGLMVGGRGVRLAFESGVRDAELFLCIDIDAGQTEALVRRASSVRRDWLPVKSAIHVEFDLAAERVIARKRLAFEDLILEESHAALPDDAVVAQVLSAAAAEHLERVLPPADSAAGSFLLRLRSLREWMPELILPAFDDAALREVVPWLCPGRRSFADLRAAPWLDALAGRLTHAQRQTVEREAPERLEVPTGSHIALTYERARPPVLAVRIQELFGLAETPRIAGGRVRVLLHLLAPNYRPQQVTDDLASFWKNTYPQVRKDLRARYPKHAWPENPLTAAPMRGPKKRQ